MNLESRAEHNKLGSCDPSACSSVGRVSSNPSGSTNPIVPFRSLLNHPKNQRTNPNSSHNSRVEGSKNARNELKLNSSVNILFKGIKRKVEQKSYSKLKNSYKIKHNLVESGPGFENSCPKNHSIDRFVQQKNSAIRGLHKDSLQRLSITSNRERDGTESDPCQAAYDELLSLKENNHFLSEENTELLRRIRKEQKLQEIYKKKLQGRAIEELDYSKALEIYLLLKVQKLEDELQAKEIKLEQKQKEQRANKCSNAAEHMQSEINDKRFRLYERLVFSGGRSQRGQLEWVRQVAEQKSKKLKELNRETAQLQGKLTDAKKTIQQRDANLSSLKAEVRVIEEKLKGCEVKGSEKVGLWGHRSNSSVNGMKQSKCSQNESSTFEVLRNAISTMSPSSIAIKNGKNSIEELEREIAKIREEQGMMNSLMQEFMDGQIRKKLTVLQQIDEVQSLTYSERQKEVQKKLRSSIKVID